MEFVLTLSVILQTLFAFRLALLNWDALVALDGVVITLIVNIATDSTRKDALLKFVLNFILNHVTLKSP